MTAQPQPRGTIFLSHSSGDKSFVQQVFAKLDRANTFYDIATIAPGADSIEAMKAGVGSSSVFVLFHSPTSNTAWVEFEKRLAEVQGIVNSSFQVLVCPILGSTHHSLPEWMKRYMACTPDFTANDIVRTIQYLYRKAFFLSYPEERRQFPGREVLKRDVSLAIMRATALSGKPLSAIVLSGVQGMGRGTLGSELVEDAFKGRPGRH
jgi:hypothetical protein